MDWSWSIVLNFLKTAIGMVVLYMFAKRYERSKKLPPGPWSFPILGSLITMNKGNAILKMQEYKEKYGKIFLMNMGDFKVTVINDYKLVQEALKRDEFQGRPDFQSWALRNGGVKNRGVLFTDGVKNWQERRRFALRNLRDFGFGKRSMEGMLLHEVDQLIQKFKTEMTSEPVSLTNHFNCSVFNSLWYIISGRRFELDDPQFTKIISMFTGHLDKITLFSPANYYPWPAKYNLIRRGLWKQAISMYATVTDMLRALIQEHLDSYDENVSRDFIDVYLHSHKKASQDSGFYGEEGINSLCVTLLDFFAAGTETTSTTLQWAVLYMTKYPHVQKKLQEEIDGVIGDGRLPTLDDKQRLPYLEAFTNEVHRKASILPMSVYHKVMQDCEFAGYLFEKDTVLYANIHDAHHDKDFWGDPENFRPERFLDATGTKVLQKEALMPFATGKRMCLGEKLARDTLFFVFCGLLRNFTFELDPLSASLNVDVPKPNFVNTSCDFKVTWSSRSK